MKIRITRDTKIPLVEKGRVFYVQGSIDDRGRRNSLFHPPRRNYLGIRAGIAK